MIVVLPRATDRFHLPLPRLRFGSVTPQAVVLYGAAAQKMSVAKSYSFGVALGVSLVSQPNIVKLV